MACSGVNSMLASSIVVIGEEAVAVDNLGSVAAIRVTREPAAVRELAVNGNRDAVQPLVRWPSHGRIGDVPGLRARPCLLHHVEVAGEQAGVALLGRDGPGPGGRCLHFLLDLLGYGLSAVTVLQGIGDDAADGVFGGLGNAAHPGATPELRGADQLRPLNGRDVVELGCQLCALGRSSLSTEARRWR